MKSHSMTTYQWADNSAICRLMVEKSPDGKQEVHLIAGENAKPGELADIPKELRRYGFQSAYADAPGGQNMVVVSKIRGKDVDKILDVLKRRNLVEGEPVLNHNEVKHEGSLWKDIQDNSLKLSGRIGLIGHTALAGMGILQKDYGRLLAAPMGASNPILLGLYGNGKDDIDFEDMVKEMGQYFKAQGIPMPKFEGEAYQRNLLQAMHHAVATHPIQIGFTLGSIGSAALIKSGLKDGSANRIAAGSMSLAGNAAVLLVKEKGAEEKEGEDVSPVRRVMKSTGDLVKACAHPKDFPAAFSNFLRSGPLMFNGMLNFLDNVFYFGDAFHQRKDIMSWGGNGRKIEVSRGMQDAFEGKRPVSVVLNDFQKRKSALETALRADESELKAGLGTKEHLRDLKQRVTIARSEIGHLTKGIGELDKLATGGLADATRLHKAAGIAEEIKLLGRQYDIAIASDSAKWVSRQKVMATLPFVTACSFVVATALSTMSSKNRNTKPEEDPVFNKLYSLVAQMLLPLSPDQREDALHRMSDYLTTRDELREVGVTSSLFEKLVLKRVAAMENSPWIERVSNGNELHLAAAPAR